MKKNYMSPVSDIIACLAKDIITASGISGYERNDSGNGEWLNWSDMQNK